MVVLYDLLEKKRHGDLKRRAEDWLEWKIWLYNRDLQYGRVLKKTN